MVGLLDCRRSCLSSGSTSDGQLSLQEYEKRNFLLSLFLPRKALARIQSSFCRHLRTSSDGQISLRREARWHYITAQPLVFQSLGHPKL